MYNINSGQDCGRLSHLIYRLHTCLDYKSKLLLATKIFNYKDELDKSKESSRRLLTSLDPEYIYLLLRSSTIFKIIGLELVNLLMLNEDNSTHLRKIVLYIRNILETNWFHKNFEYDASTKIISEKIGEPEIVWIRLIYQCLECLDKLADNLGPDYIFKYNTNITELSDSVEFLVNDMFDISMQDPSEKSDKSSLTMKPIGFEQVDCHLCKLLSNKEYKDEALVIQELYKDLDSLSKAHLEELDMNDAEERDPGDKKEMVLSELLDKLGNQFLEELKEKKEDVSLSLFCIEILIKLLPNSLKVDFVTKCVKSNNFDLIKVIMNTLNSFSSSPKYGRRVEKKHLEEMNVMMYKSCIGILESNLTRENMSFVLNYIHQVLDSVFNTDKSYYSLLKVAKRCEIEIYMSLDEVFRVENTLLSSVAFETMEKVMTTVSDAEAPFERIDEFFSVFHRTIQILFDFFDNLYDASKNGVSESAQKYKVYCLRLMSCWMTLEPMYYQNKFMDKLEKILSLLNEFDFIWLLPTFNFIELSDLDSVSLFLELLFKLMNRVTNIESGGEIGDNTVRMVCNLVTRLHLDQMIDYQKMLTTINVNSFNTSRSEGVSVGGEGSTSADDKGITSRPKPISYVRLGGNFDLNKYLSALNDHMDNLNTFKPSYPVDFLAPMCIHLDQGICGTYQLLSSVAIELLFKKIKGSRIEFVKKRLDVSYDFVEFVDDLTDEVEFEGIENLCYVVEAAASTCLSRVYEGSSMKYMDNQILVITMELVIYLFIYTTPKCSSDYLEDSHRMNHYFSLCKICILLMQNYKTFLVLFNYVIKKVCLRIATPPKEDFEIMIGEGFLVQEDLVLSEFFAIYTSNLQ